MASIVPHGERWRAFVRLRGHRPRTKLFATKREAERWARDEEAAIERARSVPAELRYTYADLHDRYVELAPSTGRAKLAVITRLRRQLGELRVVELTTNTFLRFATRREREGAGPVTIGQDLVFIGTVLRHGGAALDLGEALERALVALQTARTSLRHARRVAESRQRDRRPSDEELGKIRSHLLTRANTKYPLWDITLFAIATAMRQSEITRLQWGDLDVSRRTVVIRQRKHPQSPRDQTVPLLRGPTTVLGELIDPLEIALRQAGATRRHGRIFPYSPKAISRAWERVSANAGVADLRFHDLRHDAVSRLFEYGYPLEQVALVSGHSTWKNLARYTQLRAETLHNLKKS